MPKIATLILAAFNLVAADATTSPVVQVKNGTYVGVHNEQYDQDFFLGVPFAQPPVGQLRLARPQGLNTSWTGSRNVTEFGPGCVGFSAAEIDRPVSEDCLSINIWRPSGYEGEKLPLLVWIFGGGWIQGLNRDPRYNLTFIVNNSVKMGKPIMAASINYRLNAYGFMDSNTIRAAKLDNLGLWDQRKALEWVQDNIDVFGGDPSKVTIWGQSAGASNVGAHLVAFGGRDDKLFHSAIMDSGGPSVGYTNLNSSNTAYTRFLEETGCNTTSDAIDCLRSVSADVFANAANMTSFSGLHIDGDYLQTYGSDQLKNGAFVKVPILIGTNKDEGTSFAGKGFANDSAFETFVASKVSNSSAVDQAVAALSVLYPDIPAIGTPHTFHGRPNVTYGAQYKRAAQFSSDFMMNRHRRITTQQWANHGVPAYSYSFDAWPIAGQPDIVGTTHFTEIQFAFDNELGNGYVAPWWPQGSEFAGLQNNTIALARLMSRMYVSFVHDGNPNNHEFGSYNNLTIPEWPVYAKNGQDSLEGYAYNLRFDQNLSALVEQQPDTFRAEAIYYQIEHAKDTFAT